MVSPPDGAEEAVRRELEQQIGRRSFDHWFRNKVVLRVAGDELIVGVGSPFLMKWVQTHFRAALADVAQSVLGPSARLRFEVDALACSAAVDRAAADDSALVTPPPANDSPLFPPERRLQLAAAVPGAAPAAASRAGRRFLDLNDFVEGRCNELPLTAARQVCEAPGSRFNPLFLHGGVGTGKTHLLEGVYRRLRRQFPSLQVMFLTSEAFTNYFTEALREKTLPSFRQRFRGVDVLLVDDIDFFDNKRVIQEEFLHTFKQLESQGRQIVLTADRHPRLLSKFSDELMTRCLSGLVCRLEAPDSETRQKIVGARAARMRIDIAPEALTFVAQRFRNNVRELEGALNCLATYHSMTGKRVTLSAARRVLSDLERDCTRIVRIADVEQVVCNFFGVEPKDLRSSKRTRTVSQPRMLAIYLIRKHTQAAYSEIGQYFGGRNHSTVMSAERKVTEWLQSSEPVKVSSQTWPVAEVLETLEQHLQAS